MDNLSIYLSFYPSINLSVFIYLILQILKLMAIYLSIFKSINLSIFIFLSQGTEADGQPIYLSNYQSFSIYLSILIYLFISEGTEADGQRVEEP